jgi:hypothetical protein
MPKLTSPALFELCMFTIGQFERRFIGFGILTYIGPHIDTATLSAFEIVAEARIRTITFSPEPALVTGHDEAIVGRIFGGGSMFALGKGGNGKPLKEAIDDNFHDIKLIRRGLIFA